MATPSNFLRSSAASHAHEWRNRQHSTALVSPTAIDSSSRAAQRNCAHEPPEHSADKPAEIAQLHQALHDRRLHQGRYRKSGNIGKVLAKLAEDRCAHFDRRHHLQRLEAVAQASASAPTHPPNSPAPFAQPNARIKGGSIVLCHVLNKTGRLTQNEC